MLNEIGPEELLSRYIMQKNCFRTSDGTAKYNAFMPSVRTNDVSVYRILGLSDEEIFAIGRSFVATPMEKKLLGRADIVAECVYTNGLTVEPDTMPHERHANIRGWSASDSQKNRMIALELARVAKLHLVE